MTSSVNSMEKNILCRYILNYEEMCRRFLADSEDFSEENIAKAGITRRFSNNGELEDCISEVKSAILGGMYGY